MSQQSSARSSSGYHAPDPPVPLGGYRRAVPRDALTGEPIRPDTLHIRVRDRDRDRAQPVVVHQRAPRYHVPRVEQRAMLPNLDDLLDDAQDDANDAEDDVEVDDA